MSTIKIKRTSGSTTPTGLTFGELAYVQGIKSIYIGQTAGDPALRIGAEVDTSTALGTSDNKIPSQNAVKTYVDSIVTGGAGLVTDVNGVTGAVQIVAGTGIFIASASGKNINISNSGVQSLTGTSNQISVSGSTGAVTLSLPSTVTVPVALNVTTNLTVTGNLTVNGTTTTVNSDSMTIDDPLLTLGTSGGVPISVSDGGKDRGILFNYYSVSGKTGFFGWDASASEFVFSGEITSVSGDVLNIATYSPIRASKLIAHDSGGTSVTISPKALALNSPTYTLPDYTSGTFLVPSNEGTADYIIKSNGAGSQPTWINPNAAGFTAYAAGRLETARSIGLTGDVSGSASFNGSADINITATIAANSVALGTDTTGNYVATLSTSSTGLTVANSGAESAAVTVNFATITSGLNMGTFSFTSGEFINSSGTISIGTVDGGSY